MFVLDWSLGLLFNVLGYDIHVVRHALRDQIVEEMERNVLHFKSIIDNDPDSPDCQTVIDNIKNEAVYGKVILKKYKKFMRDFPGD